MKLYSTADVTELTDKAESTIRMLAAKHGIGRKISGTWIFTDEDVEAFRQLPGPGRPKIVETEPAGTSVPSIPR